MKSHPYANPNVVCTMPGNSQTESVLCTGRRAKLEKKDETNKGNNDRISEVVGEGDLITTIIIIQCSLWTCTEYIELVCI